MEGQACADPGARTPIGASGILALKLGENYVTDLVDGMLGLKANRCFNQFIRVLNELCLVGA